MRNRGLWIALTFVIIGSFAVLGGVGKHLIDNAPPIPAQVVTSNGRVLFDGNTIRDGQNVWQSLGGQEVGSIWGHGAYVAPDWTADWLHRESVFVLDAWARADGLASFESAPPERRAALSARLAKLMRENTYDAASDTLTLDPIRALAFED